MYVSGNTALVRVTVLIDTWWNVNAYVLSVASTSLFVLIDTWWNVNVKPAYSP